MPGIKRQNAALATRLRTAALTLATDENLCAMFGLLPDELVPYKPEIDMARAMALVSYRHMRERARNRAVKE